MSFIKDLSCTLVYRKCPISVPCSIQIHYVLPYELIPYGTCCQLLEMRIVRGELVWFVSVRLSIVTGMPILYSNSNQVKYVCDNTNTNIQIHSVRCRHRTILGIRESRMRFASVGHESTELQLASKPTHRGPRGHLKSLES